MRYLTMAAVVWAFMSAAASAQTPEAQLMAPIQKFIDSFNKGDMAGAAATHGSGADLAIIDEVPPYLWRGAQAFQAWSTDLESDAKKRGMTDPVVTISARPLEPKQTAIRLMSSSLPSSPSKSTASACGKLRK